ncbi:hypothetical protein SAMN05444972_107150 [Marininema halotolerans]|uniref:Uncharacterized protein n=1 Tax=Marininema halotolerans TaxID=1155944 RepID=A0A1I6SJR3_9BACL|nr:hypothetical protein SAMN05444972_107150 [Marininema halotolerans]
MANHCVKKKKYFEKGIMFVLKGKEKSVMPIILYKKEVKWTQKKIGSRIIE